MDTARAIKAQCSVPFIFRAGVWKPRTRPDTYQGAGEEGLAWLAEVKQTLGIPVATEVATPEHVTAALKAGIDCLWIGARTSANPIAVQAIVDALGAQNTEHRNNRADRLRTQIDNVCTLSAERSVLCQPKAVLIKNPVNADAALWLGNIERLEKTGLPVMAVHRGCNHQPCWSMAHAVRTARPDVPMLLDPSHMSGDANQVPTLLKKIAELGLDGAMVEVHCCPEKALSDNAQQITPDSLNGLKLFEGLTSLTISNNLKQPQTTSNNTELSWLRAEIDELDERLWDTIAARMDVSRRIGEWKKAHGVTPLQPDRYQTIVERINELTNERGLSTDFALQLFDLIHKESLKQQE